MARLCGAVLLCSLASWVPAVRVGDEGVLEFQDVTKAVRSFEADVSLKPKDVASDEADSSDGEPGSASGEKPATSSRGTGSDGDKDDKEDSQDQVRTNDKESESREGHEDVEREELSDSEEAEADGQWGLKSAANDVASAYGGRRRKKEEDKPKPTEAPKEDKPKPKEAPKEKPEDKPKDAGKKTPCPKLLKAAIEPALEKAGGADKAKAPEFCKNLQEDLLKKGNEMDEKLKKAIPQSSPSCMKFLANDISNAKRKVFIKNMCAKLEGDPEQKPDKEDKPSPAEKKKIKKKKKEKEGPKPTEAPKKKEKEGPKPTEAPKDKGGGGWLSKAVSAGQSMFR